MTNTLKAYGIKMNRKVANAVDALATMTPGKMRFNWRRTKVPKNDRRKVRRIFNKLNMQETLENAYKDLIVYGNVKIPLNREN